MTKERMDCWSPEIHRKMVEQTSEYLALFVQKHAKVFKPETLILQLAQLSWEDLLRLSQMHFLLSDEAKELVHEIAPEILNRLSKTSVHQVETSHGVFKGRVHWGRTYSTRAIRGGDPSLFVSMTKSAQFDLPENRLLLFMLHRISLTARKVSKEDWDEEKFDLDDDEKLRWGDEVNRIAAKSQQLLRNPFISQIGQVQKVTDQLLEQAENARGQRYTRLAEIARTYLLSMEDPLRFLQEKSQSVLEPLSKDTLFEIAVLFKVIKAASQYGWKDKHVRLIGGATDCFIELEKNEVNLRVYYQGLPSELNQVSIYRQLMIRHGLSDRARRPDIILEWVDGKKKRYCIIEIKRSTKRKYLVDGAYKVLGYLKDFESVQSNGLKGVLVGWDGVSISFHAPDDNVYITSWNNLEHTLEALFSLKSGG